MVRHGLYAGVLVAASTLVGTWGFAVLAGQTVIDAFLNAAMLLGGMGPVGEIRSTVGKLFAALFALYAGLAFLGVATILLVPVFHRVLHNFHLEEQHRRESRSRLEGHQSDTGPQQ